MQGMFRSSPEMKAEAFDALLLAINDGYTVLLGHNPEVRAVNVRLLKDVGDNRAEQGSFIPDLQDARSMMWAIQTLRNQLADATERGPTTTESSTAPQQLPTFDELMDVLAKMRDSGWEIDNDGGWRTPRSWGDLRLKFRREKLGSGS